MKTSIEAIDIKDKAIKTFDECMGIYAEFIKQDNVEVFECEKDSGHADFLIEVLKETCEYSAHFNVYAVTGWDVDDSMLPYDCELYLQAYIKWDSCCHFHFGEKESMENDAGVDGYLHLCGVSYIKKHFAIMKRVYEKAFEVMGREPEDNERLD